ncbi:glycosyltransferase, partial [Methanothermobacter tenebrarum]
MSKRVLMIIPFQASTRGGVLRAVKSQEKVYKKLGFNTDIAYVNDLKDFNLDSYDFIQVHGPLKIKSLLKVMRADAKAILTIHGWVVNENLTALKEDPIGNLHHLFKLFNWILHRLIFIPIVYKGRVTAVSRITLEKNGLKGVVIPNVLIPDDINKRLVGCKDLREDKFTAITYVSIGGSKVKSVSRLSRIIDEVNKKSKGEIQLLIFGDPVKVDNPHIKVMGYRDDFLCYLKSADIMLLGYEMSELGYAVMEAGYLSVPIAKFKGEFEELKDGIHGIIAENEEYMIKKLVEASEDTCLLREWGENLKE